MLGIDRGAARRWFERVAGAFVNCQAEYHWNARYPEREGTLIVVLQVQAGRMASGRVDLVGLTLPAEVRGTIRAVGVNPNDCVYALGVYPLAGTGEVRYVFHVKVR